MILLELEPHFAPSDRRLIPSSPIVVNGEVVMNFPVSQNGKDPINSFLVDQREAVTDAGVSNSTRNIRPAGSGQDHNCRADRPAISSERQKYSVLHFGL